MEVFWSTLQYETKPEPEKQVITIYQSNPDNSNSNISITLNTKVK
jgi:hypothetical protein